jgi:hypothetical protein
MIFQIYISTNRFNNYIHRKSHILYKTIVSLFVIIDIKTHIPVRDPRSDLLKLFDILNMLEADLKYIRPNQTHGYKSDNSPMPRGHMFHEDLLENHRQIFIESSTYSTMPNKTYTEFEHIQTCVTLSV